MNKTIRTLKALAHKLDDKASPTHLLALLLVIMVGFLLRYYALHAGQGYHYFSVNDQLDAYLVVLRFLADEAGANYIGQPYFGGGNAPGPAWTLFGVLVYKLGNNTIDGALFYFVLLNSSVIYLVYRLARHFVSPKYALATGLFYAVSPWPIYYSFGFWNPIPLAFLGALLFLSLWRVTHNENSRSVFWVCLLAAIIPHFHMIGVFYYPALLLILYLSPVRINKSWFAIGLVAGVAVYLPYITGEINTNWSNTRAIFSQANATSFGVFKVITTPIGVLSSQTGRWTGEDVANLYNFGDLFFGSFVVLLIFYIVSIGNSVIFLRKLFWDFLCALDKYYLPTKLAYKNAPDKLFLGILIVLPVLLFMITRHNYGSRYAILIFPLIFLLPAIYIQVLQEGRKKHYFISSMAVICVFNIYLSMAFFNYQADRIASGDHFIPSFQKIALIYKKLQEHAGDNHYIQIDATKYTSKDPSAPEFVTATGILRYVRLREDYVAHKQRPPQTKTYKMVKKADIKQGDIVVYESHDMALLSHNI